MNKNNPLILAILILGALSFAILPTLCSVPLVDFITGIALFLLTYIVISATNRIRQDENIFDKKMKSWGDWLKTLPWYEIIVYVIAIIFVISVVKANNCNPSHL